MIFRNSIKSILRTPVKTVLFALLIAAVTAFLYLGVNTWAASVGMLRECDENCTTIVAMEYLGDYYPYEAAYDEGMAAEVADIDFSPIAENKNVLLWQPTELSIGIADGFVAHSEGMLYNDFCVLVVRGIHQYHENSPYCGTLVESLYSYRGYAPGRFVYVYDNRLEDVDFVPDPEATYVLFGYCSPSGMSLDIYLMRLNNDMAGLSGIDCGAVLPYREIESIEALREDGDNIFLLVADYYNVMSNKLYVYRTESLLELEEFNQDYMRMLSGRPFTREEARAGAKVCVISETLANGLGLKVGDTLALRMPEGGATLPSTFSWGQRLTRTESYTVVGVASHCEGYQFNVYVPAAPRSPHPAHYIYKLGQATIKNGTAGSFLAQIKPLLPPRVSLSVYDQGYQATADSLFVIRNAAAALSLVAFAVTVAALAFFAYLFTDRQRDTVETMRCFGARKAETRLYLLIGASAVALVSIAAGIWVGTRYAQDLVARAYAFICGLQAVDTRYSDGAPGNAGQTPGATNPYMLEDLLNQIQAQPCVIFTNDVENAPEFYFDEFHGEFLPGWDVPRFMRRDWTELPCIVSTQFMMNQDVDLGDTIRVYALFSYPFGYQAPSRGPTFVELELKVVGSFLREGGQDNIYCPLSLGALDPGHSTLNELIQSPEPLVMGRYKADTLARMGEFTQQQLVDVLIDDKYVSSFSFTLRDSRELGAFKDYLERGGFSAPRQWNDMSIFVLMEDGAFNEALSGINQRSKYLQILYPILFALVCILGLITGFLVVNSRREDIALMRGMGTPKERIFRVMFGEQLALLLLGALPAAAAWLAFRGGAQLATPGAHAFFISYALSAAFSVALQNGKSALAILSEKE